MGGSEASYGGKSSVAGKSHASSKSSLRLNAGLNIDDGTAEVDNRRNLENIFFAAMYAMGKNRAAPGWRIPAVRIAIEVTQFFLVVFCVNHGFSINQDMWLYKIMSIFLFRIPAVRMAYNSYITIYYIVVGVVGLVVLMAGRVAWMLRQNPEAAREHARFIKVTQMSADFIFVVAYPAILDYFVSLFNCTWDTFPQPVHYSYPGVQCLATPHLIHLGVAVLMLLVFGICVACMAVASCDLNPVTKGCLATPAVGVRVLSLCCRTVLIAAAAVCMPWPHVQAVIMMIAVAWILWKNLRMLPYYCDATNYVMTAAWAGICFTCGMYVAMIYGSAPLTSNLQQLYTNRVLYYIWPVLVGAAGICYCWMRLALRPLPRFITAPKDAKPKEIYRFTEHEQVELLARAMRKWDLDGLPVRESIDLGELILKCGMVIFPRSVMLCVLYANFLIEIRKDGQSARTYLGTAKKNAPNLLDRYCIYACNELSQQLKDTTEGGMMDMVQFVEFQRNYRSVVRKHKAALLAQRRFWQELLRSSIQIATLEECFASMESTAARAAAAYRRVIELYPNSGQLLKCYGRFMEEVQDDTWQAAKLYTDAEKLGLKESVVDFNQVDESGKVNSFLATCDEKNDGIVVIAANGTIMMVNATACDLFGYNKGELEGLGVSVLMPQPFSTYHNQYIQAYLSRGGRSDHLEKMMETVALRKDKTVTNLLMGVIHMNGSGQESIFMGIFRRPPQEPDSVKVWVLPNSMQLLCIDSRFSDWFGHTTDEVIGRAFPTLGKDAAALTQLIKSAAEAAADADGSSGEGSSAMAIVNIVRPGSGPDGKDVDAASSAHDPPQARLLTQLLHKYTDPVDVELIAESAGTPAQPFFTIRIRCVAERAPLMVINNHGRVDYVTSELAALLGYVPKAMHEMELTDLMQPPYAQLHRHWMKSVLGRPPPTSCRAGHVVHMVTSGNGQLPVRLSMSRQDVGDHVRHVVKVKHVTPEDALLQRRLVLTIAADGSVLSTDAGADATKNCVFGFPAALLVGRNVGEFINAFEGFVAQKPDQMEWLLGTLLERTEARPGMSWRVGVHAPRKVGGAAAAATAGSRGFLFGRRDREKALVPAVLQIDVVRRDETLGYDDDSNVDIQLQLWRTEHMTGVLEVDSSLTVLRAEPAAALLLGSVPHTMQRQLLSNFLRLPPGFSGMDLVNAGPRGAMKGGTSAWKIGVVKELQGRHPDGQPLKVAFQAVSKDTHGTVRIIAKVSVNDPWKGSTDRFLQLDDVASEEEEEEAAQQQEVVAPVGEGARGVRLSTPPKHALLVIPPGGPKAEVRRASGTPPRARSAEGSGSDSRSRSGSGSGSDSDKEPVATKAVTPKKQHSRVEDWVRSVSKQMDDLVAEAAAAPAVPGLAAVNEDEEDPDAEDDHAGESALFFKIGANIEKGPRSPKAKKGPSRRVSQDEDGEEDQERLLLPGSPKVARGRKTETKGRKGAAVARKGDEEELQSVGEGSSAVDPAGGEEAGEITADVRRAKRLRKLKHLLNSGAAQVAVNRFIKRTWMLLLVMLVGHVVCFAVILTMIQAQNLYIQEVVQLGTATDHVLFLMARTNIVHKCWLPQNMYSKVCWNAGGFRMNSYLSKYISQLGDYRSEHLSYYLGVDGLAKIQDPDIYNIWTNVSVVPEQNYQDVPGNTTVVSDTNSLWNMGLKVISSAEAVYTNSPILKTTLNTTREWQYIILNAGENIYHAYATSLDMLVEYAWLSLQSVFSAVVIMMVLEALVLQGTCMVYELFLADRARGQQLRTFSSFLGLPITLIRTMAARPIRVGDEDEEEAESDDDVDELLHGEERQQHKDQHQKLQQQDAKQNQQQLTVQSGPGPAPLAAAGKHVRMSIDGTDFVGGRGGGNSSMTRLTAGYGDSAAGGGRSYVMQVDDADARAPKRRLTATWRALKRRALQALKPDWLTWQSSLTMNGKELLPNSSDIVKILAPLLCWELAVVIIYAMTFSELQGLQQPLAQLSMTQRVLALISRCRYYAGFMTWFDSPAVKLANQASLATEVASLNEVYRTLMYGGPTPADSRFQATIAPLTFQNAALVYKFFYSTACMRQNQATCLLPTNPLYLVTHSGLDAMIVRFIDEAVLYSNDPISTLNCNSSRYYYLLEIGSNDMYDGTYAAADLITANTLAAYAQIKTLHTILLILTLVMGVLYVVLILRPFIRKVRLQTNKVASMLSHLPPEVNIETVIRTALQGEAAIERGEQAASTAAAIEDVDDD